MKKQMFLITITMLVLPIESRVGLWDESASVLSPGIRPAPSVFPLG